MVEEFELKSCTSKTIVILSNSQIYLIQMPKFKFPAGWVPTLFKTIFVLSLLKKASGFRCGISENHPILSSYKNGIMHFMGLAIYTRNTCITNACELLKAIIIFAFQAN